MSSTRTKTAWACGVLITAFAAVTLHSRWPSTGGSLLASASPRRADTDRPTLPVPVSNAKPAIDGKLDEPCWKEAAVIGPLKDKQGKPPQSTTRALVVRDADHLYIGVTCGVDGQALKEKQPAKPPDISKQEHVALLFDTNHDRNSYYLIFVTPGGAVQGSYNEHFPPWHDSTWLGRKPRFQCVTARGKGAWSAELALPLKIFDKTKTLAAAIGFNIRRHDLQAGQTHCWQGNFANPAEAGILMGFPTQRLPAPPFVDYAGRYQLDGGFRQVFNTPSTKAGAKDRPISLGPGSSHPSTTGEVRIELEGFLLGGNVHARSLIWDLAVNEKNGELYVLSAARRKSAIELRVFNRQGKYLRTIMPFHPALPSSGVKDLCRQTVREDGKELVVPKLFETCGSEPSLYGEYWHLPQCLAIAPNGDLIMSNIYKRTLWRMKPDGSLPAEGWTSIYNPHRNEPFESASWLIGPWHASGLTPYLSYGLFCLPDLCFDQQGHLYVSGGVFTNLSQFYSTNWEVPGRGQGETVWKYRLREGAKVEPVRDFRFNGTAKVEDGGRDHLGVEGQPGADDGHFKQPCGLAIGDHLIVADSGNNRLQVFAPDGRLAASIKSFEHQGQQVPLHNPTGLALDRQQHLYVLAVVDSKKRLLKLRNWREPRALAISEPLDADTIRFAVDGGVDPPLVWIANGAGRGTLLQLAGDNLALKGKWAGNDDLLSSPIQYGYVPILNIDPQTGHLFVEDDSYYHRGLYGEVFRLDQNGKILKKWPPLLFNHVPNWNGEPIYAQSHATPIFRYPDEPLFLDSLFGKDGRIYRWKRDAKTVQILRFDRAGQPIPFKATGMNALVVDQLLRFIQPRNHFVYRGLDVDAQGNIYFVNANNTIDVYDAEGNLRTRELLQLMDTRGLLVDKQGHLYVLACSRGPTKTDDGYWTSRDLHLSKYSVSGGKPIWSRRWEGIMGVGAGRVAWMKTTCVCMTPRVHQALDEKGYLYVANPFSVQVIDCASGRLVGEFGSYGNMDCLGKGSAQPHPELPFGTIATLAVWKDRLLVVDGLNARIARCRIVYDPAKKCEF